MNEDYKIQKEYELKDLLSLFEADITSRPGGSMVEH